MLALTITIDWQRKITVAINNAKVDGISGVIIDTKTIFSNKNGRSFSSKSLNQHFLKLKLAVQEAA
ncbi:hypothetical protein [uncultured Psychrobacter sp.]|uniref:hypothetical protein n=1 Tax=uncultured Psychrobacter sp. TaxID=259303 RepID=UPI0034595572